MISLFTCFTCALCCPILVGLFLSLTMRDSAFFLGFFPVLLDYVLTFYSVALRHQNLLASKKQMLDPADT